MSGEFELIRGRTTRDAGIPDADTELMKADLATGIIRIMRERGMSGTEAARVAEVTEADISRVRKVALDRFTIDRLVKIHNRLDRVTRIRVDFSQPRDRKPSGTAHP